MADPYAALRHPNFRRFVLARLFSVVGQQIVQAAVGWQVYEQSRSVFALGMIGLAQVLPVVALAPWAGHLADRMDRRRIVLATQTALVLCSLALLGIARLPGAPLEPPSGSSLARGQGLAAVYAVLVAIGVARAFQGPPLQAILPALVPREAFANAVSWRAVLFQASMITGPAACGVLVAWAGGAWSAYLTDVLLGAAAVALLARVKTSPSREGPQGNLDAEDLWAGLRYVWKRPTILGALSLDLFAVLFGGATALLPVFAKEILHVGPRGFGLLRAAPAVGAIAVSLGLLHRRPLARSGRALLASVAVYGLAMIGFGLSTAFWLSLSLLIVSGLADGVSVIIRHTIVQSLTPDAMRGRVSAMNGIFIHLSNELGEFESGVAASLLGAASSVVAGGALTLAVVALSAKLFPQLGRLGRLDELGPESPSV